MRRDGQERDDRDDLGEVDRQCPDNGHELFTRPVIAAVAEKHENTARDGESRLALVSGGTGRQNCHRGVRPRNDGIREDVPVTVRLLGTVGRCAGGQRCRMEGSVL